MTSNVNEIDGLIKYGGTDRVVHFTEYLLEKASQGSSSSRFASGYKNFDEKMGGIETGEVVVVSGHRKEGKTLFVESWVRNMGKLNPNAKTVMFSYEVQPDRLLAKYVKDDTTPIYLPMELKTMDFEWLLKRCSEAKYKYNAKIIMIDHLHFQVDMNTKQNMSLNIGAYMRRLKKDIALDLNLAVILIAHQGQPREGKEASIDGIRDSSFVAQESDATIIVSRRKNFTALEVRDIELKTGEEISALLKPPENMDEIDEYSSGLAIVTIECHRRTGVYHWKKLFQKRGEFMEEV